MKRSTNQGRTSRAGAPARPTRGRTGDVPQETGGRARRPAGEASDEPRARRGAATSRPATARRNTTGEAPARRNAAGEAPARRKAAGEAPARRKTAPASPARSRPVAPGSKTSKTPRGLSDATALRRTERATAARKPARDAAAPDIVRPATVRLQKVLAAAGVTSRRKAEELIAAGAVKVNGKVVKELGTKVDPDRDKIQVKGAQVQPEKKVYFVLNKPDAVVCSAEGKTDARGRPTVLSLFPELPQRIYPVGRLDFHSRGVLVLTNDGDLAAALTHPRHEIPKTYHVKFQGKLTVEALQALAGGVVLDDGVVTRPADEVSVIKETDTNTWVQVTIRQGLNRQIRRMGDAIGHPVLKLIRVAVGPLTADGLDDGEFRPLTPTEVYDLMAAASPQRGRARSRLAPGRRAG